MKALLLLMVTIGVAAAAPGQQNLIPNCDFSAKEALQSWRIDFPYQSQYVENAQYCRVTTQLGRNCLEISTPPIVIANQGGKMETALIPAVGGASYHAEVDCLGWDYNVKVFVEAYTTDPRPDGYQGHSLFVIPGTNGAPCKVMCWRGQFTDLPHSGALKTWSTATRDFTLPATMKVAGKDCKPEWLTLKVVVWAASAITGKSYFTNFRLFQTQPPQTMR